MKKFHLSQDMILRMATDLVIVNFALMLAIFFRFVLFDVDLLAWIGWASPQSMDFTAYADLYRENALALSLISMTIFYSHGFYTHGRTYSGRYKALVILEAVGLSYVLFGVYSYIVVGMFPRSIWFMGLVITLSTIQASRLWHRLWMRMLSQQGNGKFSDVAGLIDPRPLILVIGGAGYIGSVLVRQLLQAGYRVRILDMLMYGRDSIADLTKRSDFELICGDFRSIDTIIKSMRDVSSVVHLGAIVGDPACEVDRDLSLEINLMATRMIAETAKGFNVSRLIFASTCSVYGASDQTLTEKSILNPVSLYARTKIASEKVLVMLSDEKFKPIILRFATVFGMSYRPRFDLVVNLLTARAYTDKSIKIFGGDQWRPFLHVQDISTAILKCIQLSDFGLENQILNVGANSQNHQIKQIGEIIQQILPHVAISSCENDLDRRNYRVSFSKIAKTLDFQPTLSVYDGVREIVSALKHGLPENFSSVRYNNYQLLNSEEQLGQLRLEMMGKSILNQGV
ncbi:NAD-dependent epimerase/dehydratase family protein [candidate division KSB1 bacterium]|nr:NAD-dependent epimerase/dehydratase family protein [candidate division KSB1 bacterium]